MNQRIPNLAWARSVSLFEGQDHEFMTRREYCEYLDGQAEIAAEEYISRHYGDCGVPITGTGDYELLLMGY